MTTAPPSNGAELIAQVRALIADTDPTRQILDDDAVEAYLTVEGWDALLAAAAALEAIAVSEVLVGKKIRTQDLQTDGAKVADALRKHADRLRAQADRADEDSWGGFDVIPTIPGRHRPELTEHTVWGL